MYVYMYDVLKEEKIISNYKKAPLTTFSNQRSFTHYIVLFRSSSCQESGQPARHCPASCHTLDAAAAGILQGVPAPQPGRKAGWRLYQNVFTVV